MERAIGATYRQELERVRSLVSTARTVAASKNFTSPEVGVLIEAVDGLTNLVEALFADDDAVKERAL